MDGQRPGPDAEAERFRRLPPPVPYEDIIEETDVSVPPEEPPGDPNRDTARRIGLIGDAG